MATGAYRPGRHEKAAASSLIYLDALARFVHHAVYGTLPEWPPPNLGDAEAAPAEEVPADRPSAADADGPNDLRAFLASTSIEVTFTPKG